MKIFYRPKLDSTLVTDIQHLHMTFDLFAWHAYGLTNGFYYSNYGSHSEY